MKTLPLILTALAWSITGWAEPAATQPATAAELFQTDKVWSLHFTVTPERLAEMDPTGGSGMGGPGEAGFFRQSGQPGGQAVRGGGAGVFAAQLAESFYREAGKSAGGTFSTQDFTALAEKWFDAADAGKSGRLDVSAAGTLLAGGGADRAAAGGGPPGPGGIDFEYVRAGLEFEGATLNDVGLRYSGNNTWMASRNTDKKPFKVDTNEFVKKQKIGGVSSFNLRNNINDASSLQEVLAYQLYREAGVPSPRTAYARVYLSVPGKHDRQYLGLYGMVENINKTFAEERYGTKDTAIFKPETRELFAYLGDEWEKYETLYDPKTKLSASDTARVIAFAKLVTHGTDAEFAAQLGDYLDIDEVARYFAVTVWTSGLDSILSMGHNYFVLLDARTNKFQILPWDLDHTFGAWMAGNLENLSITRPWQGNHRFLERLFASGTFKKAYLGHLADFQKTIFAPEKIARDTQKIAAAIRGAVREESAERLAVLENAAAGKSLPGGAVAGQRSGRMGNPGGGAGGPGVNVFAKARFQSVAEQLSGKVVVPASNSRGGPGGGGRRPEGGEARGLPGGGPGEGGAGMAFVAGFDTDGDGGVTRAEFVQGVSGWFKSWDADGNKVLTDAELRSGLGKLTPRRQREPGGPDGFGPPMR